MKIEELYQQKGEAVTQIEIWQAKLHNINEQIISTLNKPLKEVSKDGKEEPK